MKWIILAVFLIPSVVFAECRVIEYEDKNEVVCEGEPLPEHERADIEKRKTESERIEATNKVNQLIDLCKNSISRRLKSPATAIYQLKNKDNPIEDSNNYDRIKMTVDAQNGYGALIRNHYICTLQLGKMISVAEDNHP